MKTSQHVGPLMKHRSRLRGLPDAAGTEAISSKFVPPKTCCDLRKTSSESFEWYSVAKSLR